MRDKRKMQDRKDGKRGKRARRETLDRRRTRAFVRGQKGHES